MINFNIKYFLTANCGCIIGNHRSALCLYLLIDYYVSLVITFYFQFMFHFVLFYFMLLIHFILCLILIVLVIVFKIKNLLH